MPHLNPPQKIIVGFVALALVVGGVILVKRNSGDQPQQSNEAAAADKAAPDATKSDAISANNSDDTAPNSDKPTEQIPTQTSVSTQITSYKQADGQVTIAGTVSGTTETGACVFEFTTEHDKPVSKSVKGTVSDGATSCGPVSIPEVNFSYLGDWTAKLTFYMDNGKSTSATKTVVIK